MIVRGTRDLLTDSDSTSESWSIKVLQNEQDGLPDERPLERRTGCRRPSLSLSRLG